MPASDFLDLTRLHAASGAELCSALCAEAALFLAPESATSVHSVTSGYAQPFTAYQQLVETAKRTALQARTRAHAPFSNFLVGATLIAEDGTLFHGCNVEASSYGLTICAERTALVSGVAHGHKRFVGVVVAADTPALTPPCGACRQMLYDFAPNAVVILVNLTGNEKRFTMKELLPEAFSVSFLQ